MPECKHGVDILNNRCGVCDSEKIQKLEARNVKIKSMYKEALRQLSNAKDLIIKLSAESAFQEEVKAFLAVLEEYRKGTDQEELYYIQRRGCCGNTLLWWAKSGYTADLDKADALILGRAVELTTSSMDKFWPKSYIDKIATRQVEIANTDHREGIGAHIKKIART